MSKSVRLCFFSPPVLTLLSAVLCIDFHDWTEITELQFISIIQSMTNIYVGPKDSNVL